MKKLLTIIALAICSMTMMAQEFKIGNLTFEITSPTTVTLANADKDITNIDLSDTVDYHGTKYTLTGIGERAFWHCSSLTSVTIPNSVTGIEWAAFTGCSALTSVTIPNSVTWIGWDAFYGTALYNNPANWYNGAFYISDCLITLDTTFKGHYTILENTRLIADLAFSDCTSLTSVTIPNSVTSIGYEAFYKCTSLTSVTIPNSVTEIGKEAFCGCSTLDSVIISENMTSIGSDAFLGTALYNNPANWENGALYISDCLIAVDSTLVGKYKITEKTRLIGDGAFKGCESLKSVNIPNSMTRIGHEAFAGCSSLRSVTIPKSVKSIGDLAFYGCASLKSVTIPTSVTWIGERAIPNHTKIIHN